VYLVKFHVTTDKAIIVKYIAYFQSLSSAQTDVGGR